MLLNNYWTTKHRVSTFIQPGKVLFDEGKLSGDNSDRNIAYLNVLFVEGINFCELKKSYFASTYFWRMASFGKCRVYKFQPQRKRNKKKTVESRDVRLIFLSRSTEREAGHDGTTFFID